MPCDATATISLTSLISKYHSKIRLFTSIRFISPHFTSPHFTSLHFTSHHFTSHPLLHFTSYSNSYFLLPTSYFRVSSSLHPASSVERKSTQPGTPLWLAAVPYVTGTTILVLVLLPFCLVLSCLVLSCLVLSCLVLSCLVLSCLVLSCLVFISCIVLMF